MNELTHIKKILNQTSDGKNSSIIKTVNDLDKLDHNWDLTASIRFLRNYTLEVIEPYIKIAGYKLGIKINISYSDYDNYQQEILDIDSVLNKYQFDIVVLSLWLDNLKIGFDKEGCFQRDKTLNHVLDLIVLLKQKVNSYIAINTFLPPAHHTSLELGFLDLGIVNQELRNLAVKNNRLLLVDFENLAAYVGIEETFDFRYWFLYKSPLKMRFLQLWGDILAQAVASLKGCAKKVLVLDCDNTLWGGIIGEDGITGIQLSVDEYPGNIYYVFHKQIIELQKSGLILAICSKNNEADVMTVLDSHPHCLLHRNNFAAWRINWESKIDNLQAIAEELNLNLNSFVFIDDSPIECELIRQALPMVEVLQVPQKIYTLPKLLQNYKGFNTLGRTIEDNSRTVLYQAERERHRISQKYENLDSFLAFLELEVEIGLATIDELPRVAQLTQKTNQFNLTTRRYTQGEIAAIYSSSNDLIFVMKVVDKFGDYGLTGLAILVNDIGTCHIDTFLMSCRILGRNLEDVFLNEVLKILLSKYSNIKITSEYIATSNNNQVANFFDKRGFTCVNVEQKRRFYVFNTSAQLSSVEYIKVIRR